MGWVTGCCSDLLKQCASWKAETEAVPADHHQLCRFPSREGHRLLSKKHHGSSKPTEPSSLSIAGCRLAIRCISHLLLQERSKSPTLCQRLQPGARSAGEVCSARRSCSFSSLIVLAALQDQQGTCFHVNCLACLMSPVFYSPLNEEQICIDFGTTRAVNYWSRLAWPVPR